ncbi:putative uncharacterized protein [Firmicutes bacterium CAG:882]|nr:putative uncharacterized protein [Firmicutes bacterium CAG:882]
MNKLEELLAQAKGKDLKDLKELLGKKQVVVEEKKKCNPLVWILAIVGFVAAVAGIAYAVYRYFTPDYLEDFEDEDLDDDDDFDDDDNFEDDFFEEEKEEPEDK